MNFPCDCGTCLGSHRDSGSQVAGKHGGAGVQEERLRGLGCAIDVYFVG